jgi:hypothetical protein
MSTQQAVSQDHWVDHLKDIIEFTKKEISQTKGKRKLAELNRSLSILRKQLREATVDGPREQLGGWSSRSRDFGQSE